jgi:nucleoid DNA-binding protein
MSDNNQQQLPIGKDAFIRLVAHEANFTMKDTYLLWSTIEKIIARAVEAEIPISIPGFGKFTVTTIPPRNHWDGINKKFVNVGETKHVNFRVSSTLRNLVNNREYYGKNSGNDEKDDYEEDCGDLDDVS